MKIKTVVDLARQHLEDSIIRGHLHPGQQIKEEDIASRLGISRPPVREALKILETEGLITRKPRRGVFVTEIKEKDIWEIYTIKIALYELSIHLAFDRLSEEVIKKLKNAIQQMEGCMSKEPCDRIKYQKFHEDFHHTIINITGNQRLKRIISILHNQVKRISYASLSDKEHLRESCNYHRKIFEALKKGDKALAEKLTREHILKGLNVAQKLIAQKHSGTIHDRIPF